MKPTKSLLIAFLALSACDKAGDFCQVMTSPLEFEPTTSVQMVKTDRSEVEEMATLNEYGGKFCSW